MTEKFEREALFKALPASGDKRVFYCVVLEPDSEDLQKDVINTEEIEKAAWAYLVDARVLSDAHQKVDGQLVLAPAEVVESFLAPVDYEIGPEKIRKGSWVLGVRVNDIEMWQNVVEGKYNGLSIGGEGIRTPL